ncbi:hypothetical protein KBC03_05730 [Patescibacteria group bacterium]|nr:hypothetical protein [Patescibacteria group bacterium]
MKSRYITEPLPVLRNIQERVLFLLQAMQGHNTEIINELSVYGMHNGYKIDDLIKTPSTPEGF